MRRVCLLDEVARQSELRAVDPMGPVAELPEHAPLTLAIAVLLAPLMVLLPGWAALAVARARGALSAFCIGAILVAALFIDSDLALVRSATLEVTGRADAGAFRSAVWLLELPVLAALRLSAFAGSVASATYATWRGLVKPSIRARLGTSLSRVLIAACPLCCVFVVYFACHYFLPALVTFKHDGPGHFDRVMVPWAALLWLLAFALPGCLALGGFHARGRLRLYCLAAILPVLAAMRQCEIFAKDMTSHALAPVVSLWIIGQFSGVAAVALDWAVVRSRVDRVLVSRLAPSARATFSLSTMLTAVGVLCVFSAALFAPLNRVSGVLLYLLIVLLPTCLLVGVLRAHGPLYAFCIGALFAAAACLMEVSPRPLSGGLSVFHRLRRSELVADRQAAVEYWKLALCEGCLAMGAQSTLSVRRRALQVANRTTRIFCMAGLVSLGAVGLVLMALLGVTRAPIQRVLPAVAFALPGCLGAAIAYAHGPLRAFCIGAVCIVTQGTLVLITPETTIGTLDLAFYEGLLSIAGMCGCVIAGSDWATTWIRGTYRGTKGSEKAPVSAGGE
jgi:hypothetical protein